jgi:tight adherence protein C
MPVLPFVSPNDLLLASGTMAAGCLAAAFAVTRHLARVEARLRAVEALTPSGPTPAVWTASVERLVVRAMPRSYQRGLQRRLDRARLAGRLTPAQLVLTTAALGAGAATVTAVASRPSAALMLFPAYVILAALAVGFWLDRRAALRRQAVQRSLPATLDLLVLALEAGMSLDGSLREVVAEWHSPASRELERVSTLTQFGMSRGEALQEVAESLDLEILRRLASRVSAAERLGTSLVLILRAEADEARHERRTIASRRIAQAPTKILIPAALLILPATLIVLLGPAIPQVLRAVGG